MRKVIVYTQSLNHLNERVFISRINIDGFYINEFNNNGFNNNGDIKLLKNPDISVEDISEINKIIKTFSLDDDITIYPLTAYINKNNNMKDKWVNTDEGKEFNSLRLKYNIKLERYNKGNSAIKKELIKSMTALHKKINLKHNNNVKPIGLPNESRNNLKQNKVYNDNDKIKDIVNVFLRGAVIFLNSIKMVIT